METSILLARIIGVVYLVMGLSLLFNKEMYNKLMAELKQSGLSKMFMGLLAIVLGMLIVNTHNVWEWTYQGLITFIGWVVLLKWVAMLLWPKQVLNWSDKMSKGSGWRNAALVFSLVVGLYLTYVGFWM